MFPENAFYPHLSFFNYQFSIIGFPLKFIPDFSEINSNSNPVFIHSGDHTGSPLSIISFLALLFNSRSRSNLALLFSCHSCASRNPVLCFFNRQSAISNRQGIYLPLTFILSPLGRGIFNYQLPFAECRFRATAQGRPYQ